MEDPPPPRCLEHKYLAPYGECWVFHPVYGEVTISVQPAARSIGCFKEGVAVQRSAVRRADHIRGFGTRGPRALLGSHRPRGVPVACRRCPQARGREGRRRLRPARGGGRGRERPAPGASPFSPGQRARRRGVTGALREEESVGRKRPPSGSRRKRPRRAWPEPESKPRGRPRVGGLLETLDEAGRAPPRPFSR